MQLAKDHAGDVMPSIIVPDLDMTLIRAIEFISGYCNKHKTCANCKLVDGDGCCELDQYSACDFDVIAEKVKAARKSDKGRSDKSD